VINNRSGDLITKGNITPAGSIYKSNASPIYLKLTGDLNHYIKYDAVYDGPKIGFFYWNNN